MKELGRRTDALLQSTTTLRSAVHSQQHTKQSLKISGILNGSVEYQNETVNENGVTSSSSGSGSASFSTGAFPSTVLNILDGVSGDPDEKNLQTEEASEGAEGASESPAWFGNGHELFCVTGDGLSQPQMVKVVSIIEDESQKVRMHTFLANLHYRERTESDDLSLHMPHRS